MSFFTPIREIEPKLCAVSKFANHKMRLESIEIQQVISRGVFGVVHKVARKSDGKIFALKQVHLNGMNRSEREECIDEARILSRLHHPFLVGHVSSYVGEIFHNVLTPKL